MAVNELDPSKAVSALLVLIPYRLAMAGAATTIESTAINKTLFISCSN
jgi:hypothetical protein